MKRILLCLAGFMITLQTFAQTPLPAEIKGPFVWKSKIYPGTERNYWIYVPKQYDASRPACSMIVQDGLSRAMGWRLPQVLDSLILIKRIPVVVGIFIDPGIVPSAGADNYPRYNRSFEYDGMGDAYARFLLEEIIPEVSKTYNLSKDPNDRSIAGASSGAICAFNAAWERPDEFRRVLSTIGTYVGLRGADEFATLVRKTEAKPLRVFLQDGTKDLNIYAGDWWMANQDMLSALTYSGYEVNHAWGEGGGHDSKHSITIMAEALEWLWKDYPQPVTTHKGTPARINVLIDGEQWKDITPRDRHPEKIAINEKGNLYLADKKNVYKSDGSLFTTLKGAVGGMMFGPDETLYVIDPLQQKLLAIDSKGAIRGILSKITAGDLAVTGKGLYFSDTKNMRIGYYSFGKKEVQYVGTSFTPSGLAVSSDQAFLNVSAANAVFGYSYKINDNGNPDYGQPFIHYHIPYGQGTSGASGMTVDAENLLYTSTYAGIQISDQLGRVNLILSKPGNSAMDVKFGGSDFKTLYVIADGKLFSRSMNAKGTLSWMSPQKPPKPGL